MSPSPGRLKFVDHSADDVLLWVTSDDPDDVLRTTRALWAGCVRDLISADLVRRQNIGGGPGDLVATDKGQRRATELRAGGRDRTAEVAR